MFGVLRTILALMVVALHIGGVELIGAYAVFCFYVLSGYLMTLIMQEKYGYSRQGVIRYSINRFLRIYPLYWLSLLVSLSFVMYFGDGLMSAYHRAIYQPQSIQDVLRNVFLFFPNREMPRLTPPSWALTVELFFYVLIGFGLSRKKNITLLWLSASVIYHVVALLIGAHWYYRYFTIPAASVAFATGATIYHYKYKFNDFVCFVEKRVGIKLAYPILILVFLNWYVGLYVGTAKFFSFYFNFLLFSILVVCLVGNDYLFFSSRRVDKFIGDLSYPIYLFHYQVAFVVIVAGSSFGVVFVRPEISLMLVTTPLLMLFAYFVARYIERPIDVVRKQVERINFF